MKKNVFIFMLFVVGFFMLPYTQHFVYGDETRLPNQDLVKNLEELNRERVYGKGPGLVERYSLESATGRDKKIEQYDTDIKLDDDIYRLTTDALLLLNPSAMFSEVAWVLDKYDLKVVDRIPPLGLIRVYSPSSFYEPLPFAPLGPTLEERLNQEDAIKLVVPNTVMESHARPPSDSDISYLTGSGKEHVGWWMDDAGVTPVWKELLQDEYNLGVIDDGFARHDDLIYSAGDPNSCPLANDHGNHVSGIACAQHDGFGVKGVLPNCTVHFAARSRRFDLDFEDDPLSKRQGLFSDVIATARRFVDRNSGKVKTINISMGYKWRESLSLNPQDAHEKALRNGVRTQGIASLTLLDYFNEKGGVIVSSAGNDSAGLSSPISARWASPFNWAAMEVAQLSGWRNGIVVEAHDISGKRLELSNIDGAISAPGEEILSSVARGPRSYAPKTGTSMAAPFVAAAFEALRVRFPTKSPPELIRCLTDNNQETNAGTPKLNLQQAIKNCSC